MMPTYDGTDVLPVPILKGGTACHMMVQVARGRSKTEGCSESVYLNTGRKQPVVVVRDDYHSAPTRGRPGFVRLNRSAYKFPATPCNDVKASGDVICGWSADGDEDMFGVFDGDAALLHGADDSEEVSEVSRREYYVDGLESSA
jgi:hypothetical protein